ncbi:putative colanic acid biosynthesis UDP-glucose lipid carrier transferase [Thermonema lapsum]|uniref:Putative colanic acid biosynthesis UDP-glucose lipid carrier transferase n=1 Tax=Thermonema lapsum TaxID=28195 RepID=A0A846MRK5_9BACT|nr:exopolysaccharide biosynthesis polyprenyl glycosylphosphotransferase [Thermonema lapsum]NIK74216.1 putative colanic acid biosynthesis UDP-glucose lipid carrier transferase [Thermonema lapsum]
MFQSASTTTQVNQRPGSFNEVFVHIDIPLDKPGNALLKRGFDIVFSLLVVIFVLSWLVPLLALLIKLDSRGPVFFIQERGGKNGKTFRCIKFRTMRYCPRDTEYKPTLKNDCRVTRLGAWLRRTSLDELPQFFNVLKGDMSVIGPRPHAIQEDEKFSELIPNYPLRYLVKPGITGLAQINGNRGFNTDLYKSRVNYDLYYIQNWSFWLDLKIILSTALKVVFGDKYAF